MLKKPDFKAEFEKQRTAGVDIADPMNNLITKKEPEPVKEDNGLAAVPGKKKVVIQHNDMPKKSRRLQMLMTQEPYDRVKAAADKNKVSFNEFVSQVLDQIVE